MDTIPMRTKWLGWVAMGVLAFGAGVAAAFVVAGDDGEAPASVPRDVRDEVVTQTPAPTPTDVAAVFASVVADHRSDRFSPILARTSPSPDCALAADRPVVSDPESEVVLEVVTLHDGCLAFTYELVELENLEARLDVIAIDDDVVAAAPLLLEPFLHQGEDEEQWPLAFLGPTDDSGEWPSGDEVVVAVIDTGLDSAHADLIGRVASRYPIANDPGGDAIGHGTHVAGIIAARPGGGGIRGVAPGVLLLDAPAVDVPHLGTAPTPAEAIRWATDVGADVINMSFGFRPRPARTFWDRLLGIGQAGSVTESLELALAYAHHHGVTLVASGGNCGDPDSLASNCDGEPNALAYPAASAYVLATAATTADDERAGFSSMTEFIDIAAPGSDIVSLLPGQGVGSLSGTSQAAPHVSGAAALLIGGDGPLAGEPRSRNRADDIRRLLLSTATDLGPPGRDDSFGAGRLEIEAALRAAGWDPEPVWLLAATGVGPLRIGASWTKHEAALVERFGPYEVDPFSETCGLPELPESGSVSFDNLTLYLERESPVAEEVLVGYVYWGTSPVVRSTSGVRVGDTLDALRTAHPEVELDVEKYLRTGYGETNSEPGAWSTTPENWWSGLRGTVAWNDFESAPPGDVPILAIKAGFTWDLGC